MNISSSQAQHEHRIEQQSGAHDQLHAQLGDSAHREDAESDRWMHDPKQDREGEHYAEMNRMVARIDSSKPRPSRSQVTSRWSTPRTSVYSTASTLASVGVTCRRQAPSFFRVSPCCPLPNCFRRSGRLPSCLSTLALAQN